jgi:hypothetical protein
VKLETFATLVLVGALGAGTLPLIGGLRSLKREVSAEHAYADVRQAQFVPTSTSGVDVWGQLRYERLPANAKRFVLFGLRHATLREDLRFWEEISSRLAAESSVHLVAYCDGGACARAVARQKVAFAVMQYGEAVTVQAVLNADATGQSILADGSMRPLRPVSWRASKGVVEEIVKEVLK